MQTDGSMVFDLGSSGESSPYFSFQNGDFLINTNDLHVDISSNKVNLGTTTSPTIFRGSRLNIHDTNSNAGFTLGRWDGGTPQIRFTSSNSGTIGTHGIVTNGQDIGGINWVPDDGSAWDFQAARFVAEVDDSAPAVGDIGMAFFWMQMSGDGSAARETMRIAADGTLTVSEGNIDVNSNSIVNVATPTSDNDAANKSYVDGHSSNNIWTRIGTDIAFTNSGDTLSIEDTFIQNGHGLVIGNDSQITASDTAELQLLGSSVAGDSSFLTGMFSNDANAGIHYFLKSRSGTIGTSTIVQDNDHLGCICWLAADGVDFTTEAAQFYAEVDDSTPAEGDIGTAFVWQQNAGGGGGIGETMRLAADGDLTVANDIHGQGIFADGGAFQIYHATGNTTVNQWSDRTNTGLMSTWQWDGNWGTAASLKVNLIDATNYYVDWIVRTAGEDGTIDRFGINSVGDLYVDTDTLYVDFSADEVGVNTTNPKTTLHIVNGGATSGMTTTPAGRGIAITGDLGNSRLYFENVDADAGERVFEIINNTGVLSFDSLNDTAAGFVNENILTLDHSTGDVAIGAGNAKVTSGNIQAYGAGGISSNFCGGSTAGNSLIGGALNTLVGYGSGSNIDEGDQNTLLGYNSGNGFTYESFVTAVGSGAAGGAATSLNRAVAFGAQALSGASSSQYTVAIGMGAGRDASSQDSVFLGYQVGEDETENRKLIIGNRYNNLIEGSFYDYWMNINSSINTPYGGFGRYQNLCRYSEDLSLSPWIDYLSYVTIVTDNATAPNGETTADTVTWDTLGRGLRHINLGLVNGQTYTVSFWASAVTQDSQTLEIDLGEGTAGSVAILSGKMRRYSVTLTATVNDWMDLEYNGTAGDAFEFWGFQVNDGSIPYNYLKTTDVILDTEYIGASVEGNLYTESMISSGDITLLNDQEDANDIIFDSNVGSVASVGNIKFQTNTNDILSIVGQLTSPTNDYGEFQFWTKGSDGTNERMTIDETGILAEGTYPVLDQRTDFNQTTGWLYGGQVTVNGGDNTLIDITAGKIRIVDYATDTTSRIPVFTDIEWTAQTALDPGTFGRSIWVGVEDDGAGNAQFVFEVGLTPTIMRDTGILCRLLSNTGDGQISSVLDFERPAWGLTNALQDWILQFGSYTIEGNKFTPNDTNLLLDRGKDATNKTWRYHTSDTKGAENVHSESESLGITAYNYHLQGNDVTTLETDIDPDYIDVSGTKTAMTSDYWSIQEIWYFPSSGTTHVLYGQVEYDSIASAIIGLDIEDKVRNTEILDGAIFRTYVIIQEGATNLDEALIIQEPVIGKPSKGQGRVPQYIAAPYSMGSNPGVDEFYLGGFYESDTTDANLSTTGTTTQVFGNAADAKGAHAFAVFNGGGNADLVLTVSGTSITDTGVKTTSDSEVIASGTVLTDYYVETTKKWLGQVTYTISTTGTDGTYDFNYGFAAYEDFANRDFRFVDFKIEGLASSTTADLNFEVLKHSSDGWTYAATGFEAGSTPIISMSTDYGDDVDITSDSYFRWKRVNLSTIINGSSEEGILIRGTQATINAIRYANAQLGVLI
jgi:hypothetical protein